MKGITTLPKYGEGVSALRRAIEKEHGRIVLIGRPGVGKSVITGRLLYRYEKKKWEKYEEGLKKYRALRDAGANVEEPESPPPSVVAVNLRQQINVWEFAFKTSGVYARALLNEWVVIEPKYRLCDRGIIKKSDDIGEILEKCLLCPLRGKCRWYQQFKRDARIYIITHEQLPVLMLTNRFRFDVVVIDEADTLFDAFSHEIPRQKVEEILKKLRQTGMEREAEELMRRLTAFYDYYPKLDIFVPKWLYPYARVIIEVTATAPFNKSLYEYLAGGFEWYVALDEEESEESAQHEEYDYTKRLLGYVLLKEQSNLDVILLSKEIHYVKDADKWLPDLVDTVVYIVRELGKTVGVTLPNYELTKRVAEELRDKGIEVFSDTDFRHIEDYEKLWKIYKSYGGKKVELITVAGRFSRGVSMEEKDVIIATFQRTPSLRLNKKHLDILEERAEKIKDIPKPALSLRQFFNASESLQALFRFNRKPSQPHIVILWDKRLVDAFRITTLKYYFDEATKIEFSSTTELKRLLKSLS